MGPKPGPNGSLKWESLLGHEGSPIEYSWKWNTAAGKPDVRFTMEGINQFTGAAMDPLNQQASIELLHRLKEAIPSVDLTWANHFINTLFDHDRSRYVQQAAAGAHYTTTIMTAAEFLPAGMRLKTYFIPRRLGQTEEQIPMALWEEKLDPDSPARAAMHKFLNSHPEGQALSPLCVPTL